MEDIHVEHIEVFFWMDFARDVATDRTLHSAIELAQNQRTVQSR